MDPTHVKSPSFLSMREHSTLLHDTVLCLTEMARRVVTSHKGTDVDELKTSWRRVAFLAVLAVHGKQNENEIRTPAAQRRRPRSGMRSARTLRGCDPRDEQLSGSHVRRVLEKHRIRTPTLRSPARAVRYVCSRLNTQMHSPNKGAGACGVCENFLAKGGTDG
jgi:hypothetical protein